MKWISPGALSRLGMLGINARNRNYIARYNPRRAFPLVDNKLKTKLLMETAGLSTPRLLFVVEHQYEVRTLEAKFADLDAFCIKPGKGSGGKGILVVEHRRGDIFVKSSGAEIDIEHIRRHVSNALAGLYSLGGNPDRVLVEELIEFDPVFAGLSHEGVPDIRIVVFRGYPVMAMVRLATHASDGKANLHQGAVGVGLDLATGRAVRALQYTRPIEVHPDTGVRLDNIEIADWRNMLLLAARCYEPTGLGYLGADLVLDRSRGALLLELNARPGLAIQVANGCGLLPRLRAIEARADTRKEEAAERVDFAMSAFAAA
ncbi:MAG: alpha-L-glutamate ligase-like protein [Gammaproteobacteria bacterium]|nr:alpha-L-glutamate ligase-like protein [Gammaproteobacteria bacterium]